MPIVNLVMTDQHAGTLSQGSFMTTLKQQLVKKLEAISGVEHRPWPDRDDGFSALVYHGKELGHFHHHNELDLKLTKNLIKQEGLKPHSDSKAHPKRSANSPWIELRFTQASDLDEVVRLVKLAVSKL
jgi:hypothetical protein